MIFRNRFSFGCAVSIGGIRSVVSFYIQSRTIHGIIGKNIAEGELTMQIRVIMFFASSEQNI